MSKTKRILFYKKLKIIKNSVNKNYKIPKIKVNMDDVIQIIKIFESQDVVFLYGKKRSQSGI
jgi:hypothetical protein